MNSVIGIEITQNEAAVALMDQCGSVKILQEDAQTSYIPRLCLTANTGDMLVGQRAVRYSMLNDAQPLHADDGATFAHIAQLLRRNFPSQTLPPVVLSVRSLDVQRQKALAQAACECGLNVVRCVNSLSAYAFDLALSAPTAEGHLSVALPVDDEDSAFMHAEIDYSDGVWEMLSCAMCADAPAGSLSLGGEPARRNALHAVARGAAVLCGKICMANVPVVSDLLLMDVLAADILAYQTDGTPLALMHHDTTVPARADHVLPARDILDANGRLYIAVGADNVLYTELTDPALLHCANLCLSVSVDAGRKVLLTVSDAVDANNQQSFVLLELTANPPPEQNAPQPCAATMDDALQALLEAMDGLENGLRMLSDAERESSVGKGMLQIHKSFAAALEKLGVEPIPAVGCLFDPQLHEAVVAMPHECPGWVLQEYRRGYLRNGALLRPAQVMVAQ